MSMCDFFFLPSRGRTKQLKADTVALAKTWHGAPHTAAEMFPGENPAPSTCKSLPPRQPSETNPRLIIHKANLGLLHTKFNHHSLTVQPSQPPQNVYSWSQHLHDPLCLTLTCSFVCVCVGQWLKNVITLYKLLVYSFEFFSTQIYFHTKKHKIETNV